MAPEFTGEQRDAIAYRKLDACVVAGPGSGKTTVLVERYRGLIENEGFDPGEILAITFTEKAAANMKAKLAAKLKAGEIDRAWVSTIHGFCTRLLKENPIAAGVDPRFTVLDPRELESLQERCLAEALDEMTAARRDETLDLIRALQTPDMVSPLREAWDAMRSAGMTVDEVEQLPSPVRAPSIGEAAEELSRLKWPPLTKGNMASQQHAVEEWIEQVRAGGDPVKLIGGLSIHLSYVPKPNDAWREFRDITIPAVKAGIVERSTAPFRKMIFEALRRFEEIYAQAKSERGALDFNDLERYAIRLLGQNPEVKDRVRRQFRQVMLDEFQDINEQQQILIDHVRAEDSFFGVGDLNQSIYGFRHARPKIFEDYRQRVAEQGRHSVELTHNFRSRNEILRFVEALLNGAEGIDPRQLVAGASFTPKSEPSVEIVRAIAADADEASEREARWIAHRIQDLRRTAGFEFRDFAVLCRSREGMTPILGALTAAGIPNVCGRRESFLLTRDGLDITALLHAVANPRDAVALNTVLRSPLVGLSDEALLASKLKEPLEPEEAARLERFQRLLRRWRHEQPVTPLDVLLARMLDDCGFALNEDTEAFLSLARTRGVGKSLAEFLNEVESMANALTAESDLSDEDQGNRVQVMTAHAAKGLEYAVTIVAAMHRGVQRNLPPVTFTPDHGLGVRWGAAGDYDSWGNANKAAIQQREEAESNRLLYVAMTRAKEHLVLSYAYAATQRGEWSRMVDEFFGLKEIAPSNGSRVVENNGVKATLWAVDEDPPARPFLLPSVQDADPIETVIPLETVGQSESSVSVTALNIFAKCPRKYYIGQFIGWGSTGPRRFDAEALDDDGADEEGAAELGSAVHDLLAGKPGEYSREAQELAAVFTEGALGKRAARASCSAREWEFIVEIEGTLVRGSVDLWFEEDGAIHLVDYKTDAVSAAEAVVRAEFYAPQLALYAHAIGRASGRAPASASLHFLKPDVVVECAVGDARGLITTLREAQANLRFELNEGPHCRRCDFYRSSCPAA